MNQKKFFSELEPNYDLIGNSTIISTSKFDNAQKWCTDVTESKYGNGKEAYLSAIIDHYDKSIVSYILGHIIIIIIILFLRQSDRRLINCLKMCFAVT